MRIEGYSFGRIRIDGVGYSKDVILLGGEVISPWWRSAGGHVFAPDDLSAVIEAAPEVVCLGTGAFGRVRVQPETVEAFARSGTEVIQYRTARAVEEFNRLTAEGRDVAAALHLTC
jgi:hypothetical protein